MGKFLVGGNKLARNAANNEEAPRSMRGYGLTAYEIAGGRLLKFSDVSVYDIRAAATKFHVDLSVHAQYATTVISSPRSTPEQVLKYMGNALKYSHEFNAATVVHPGGKDEQDVIQHIRVINNLEYAFDHFPEYDRSRIYLETMDGDNYGSYDQLMDVADKLGTRVCVDFTHIWARAVWKQNAFFNKRSVRKMLKDIAQTNWGDQAYFHISGASVSPTGEANHTGLQNSNFPYLMVLEELAASDVSGRIIVESGADEATDAQLVAKFFLDNE